MRTIASTSGAQVTGITINDYQVKRATYHNERVSTCRKLDSQSNCHFVVCLTFLLLTGSDYHVPGLLSQHVSCAVPPCSVLLSSA